MLQSTPKGQKDTPSTLQNAEETPNKNSSIVERDHLEGTPFWAIKTGTKWFLAMGDNRLTELKDTKEEVIDELENKKWFIIMCMIATIVEKMNQENDQKNIEALREYMKKENVTLANPSLI